jgi:hypothetical protein
MVDMAPFNSSRLPDPVTPVQGSSETYPRLNIPYIIGVCSGLSILVGIMFYVAVMKILRHIRGTLPCEKDVDQKSEISADDRSVACR